MVDFKVFWRDPVAMKAEHFTHRLMVYLLNICFPRIKKGYTVKFLKCDSTIPHIMGQYFLIKIAKSLYFKAVLKAKFLVRT